MVTVRRSITVAFLATHINCILVTFISYYSESIIVRRSEICPTKPLIMIFHLQVPHQLSVPYIRNNLEFIGFTTFFILLNLGLFISRIFTFWDFKNHDGTRNWWVIVARAGGQALNFTSMFILVLMLRHSITRMREMGLAVILPLDRHIYFHKVTGRLIVLYSLIHTGAHLGNLCKYCSVANSQCENFRIFLLST